MMSSGWHYVKLRYQFVKDCERGTLDTMMVLATSVNKEDEIPDYRYFTQFYAQRPCGYDYL